MEERIAPLPYPRPRPGQLEVAARVASAVSRGAVAAVYAPTGFGKTAAVLAGVLGASGSRRVLYLVRTRNEIAPVLRELGRFGVGGYTFLYSAARMCPLLRGRGLRLSEFWESCRTLRAGGRCSFYRRLQEADTDEVSRVVSSGRSPGGVVSALSSRGLCPFFALRSLVGSSRIVVATYPYFLQPSIFDSVFEGVRLSDLVLVVDEAHSLLTAGDMLEVTLAAGDVERAMREVREYHLPSRLAERLEELLRLLDSSPTRESRIERARVASLLGEAELWRDAAEDVRRALLRRGEPPVPALARVAEAAEAAEQEYMGSYVSRRYLRLRPVDLCEAVGSRLSMAHAVILVSGSMPGRRVLESVLCLRGLEFVDATRYMDGSGLYVVVTSELTSRLSERGPRIYTLYARYIATVFSMLSRSLLAVYPSYEFMGEVVSRLQGLVDGDIVVETRGTSIEDVERIVKSRGHVLVNAVAGGKLAEGVEFREDGRSLVSGVFVAGVPYPSPDDYIVDEARVLERRSGGSLGLHEFLASLAAIKVVQAVGRARRGPADKAVVVLGDRRFAHRSMRERLGPLCSSCKLAGSLGELVAELRRASRLLGGL